MHGATVNLINAQRSLSFITIMAVYSDNYTKHLMCKKYREMCNVKTRYAYSHHGV